MQRHEARIIRALCGLLIGAVISIAFFAALAQTQVAPLPGATQPTILYGAA